MVVRGRREGIKNRAGANPRPARDIHLAPGHREKTVRRIDLAADFNISSRIAHFAAANLRRLVCQRRTIKFGGVEGLPFLHLRLLAVLVLLGHFLVVAAIKKHIRKGRVRPQREATHIEYPVRAHRDAALGEEIHIAADLIVLDGIHHAVDVDAAIHHIDLALRLVQVEIRHVLLRQREFREAIERAPLPIHLLVVHLVLLPARRRRAFVDVVRGNRRRHRHRRLGGIGNQSRPGQPRSQSQHRRLRAAGLLPLVSLHQLRTDYIAAPGCIPYDLVYVIHGRPPMKFERIKFSDFWLTKKG